MILGDPRLKKVLLFLEIHHFAHPREGILYAWILLRQTELHQTTIADIFDVFPEDRRIQTEHSAGHGIVGVSAFQLYATADQVDDFLLESL